jgi:hypothetical protein
MISEVETSLYSMELSLSERAVRSLARSLIDLVASRLRFAPRGARGSVIAPSR